MTRIRIASCAAAAATLLVLLSGRSAGAQGTMTPSQPPPLPAEPPPVQPAQPTPTQSANAEPVAGPAVEAPRAEPRDPALGPPAHTGFQMAVRGGVAIPLGSLAKDRALNDVFGPQAAFSLDIGGKVIPNLFIGGYLGLNLGGSGGKLGETCGKNGVTCVAATLRIGAQVQYHIIPDGKINPWVGYGIGIESSAVSQQVGGVSVTESAAGFEFAHLMGGADFRVSKTVGIGPVVDFSVAQYSSAGNTGSGGTGTVDIKDKAIHEWLTIGARLVILP